MVKLFFFFIHFIFFYLFLFLGGRTVHSTVDEEATNLMNKIGELMYLKPHDVLKEDKMKRIVGPTDIEVNKI